MIVSICTTCVRISWEHGLRTSKNVFKPLRIAKHQSATPMMIMIFNFYLPLKDQQIQSDPWQHPLQPQQPPQ